tara:strand:+ start:2491 stop:3255 length:765 start_codon:yes stop_codon:yes gene_type:complete
MPDINPTIVGSLRASVTDFSSDDAWDNTIPDTLTTATATYTGDYNSNAIYTLFGLYSATISTTDLRYTIMSFDTSGISDTPDSATLKVYGYNNSATGQPSSHSTNGILCLKTLMAAPGAGIASGDWDGVELSGTGPVVYSDTLTSWNVGTSTTNDFTLNATALSDMSSNSQFDILVVHKAFYDWYDNAQPFAWTGNSPNGDNDFTAVAGMYWSDATYQPVLTYTAAAGTPVPNTTINVESGKITTNGGSIKINQ